MQQVQWLICYCRQVEGGVCFAPLSYRVSVLGYLYNGYTLHYNLEELCFYKILMKISIFEPNLKSSCQQKNAWIFKYCIVMNSEGFFCLIEHLTCEYLRNTLGEMVRFKLHIRGLTIHKIPPISCHLPELMRLFYFSLFCIPWSYSLNEYSFHLLSFYSK